VKARSPHDGDEDLFLPHFAGRLVDNHMSDIAGEIDEQVVATHVGLAHGD
jgi:hypothetical protein